MDNFEPMDIDRSSSSASKMDISYNESGTDLHDIDDDYATCPDTRTNDNSGSYKVANRSRRAIIKTEKYDSLCESELELEKEDKCIKPPRSSIKKYHIKLERREKNAQSEKPTLLMWAALILGVSLVYITYLAINFKCTEEIDIRKLRKIFLDNLYGQSSAAYRIIEALNKNASSKILFLYGGTGVGKTHATNLMLEKIWNYANIYHYTMPTFADTFSPELMFGLIVCKSSILVVDGLSRNDMHITTQIQDLIIKSNYLGKNITIILIYNCDNITENFVKKCDDSFKEELEGNFKNIQTEKHYIQFQPLTQEHLVKCIEKELGHRKVNRQEMDNILKNFDVTLDGCKGVYTKIKYYNVV